MRYGNFLPSIGRMKGAADWWQPAGHDLKGGLLRILWHVRAALMRGLRYLPWDRPIPNQ